MPTVRTTCPNCDVVTVAAPAVTVRAIDDASRHEAMFVCPDCDGQVVHPLNERMVPVLIGAGCTVDVAGPEVAGPDITEVEIEQFVRDLGSDRWFDELAY